MPSKIRLQRISDRIRQELSEMLIKEVADPRLSGISVTDVKVDRELAFADIFVSAVEGQERSKEVLDGLRSAAGFLRHELAARVELRAFPKLRFHWDMTPERADHIERVLAELRAQEASRQNEAVEEAETFADEEAAAREGVEAEQEIAAQDVPDQPEEEGDDDA